MGSVLDLINILIDRYNIKVGIYILNSSCYKFVK
jgi:hypothetical protein